MNKSKLLFNGPKTSKTKIILAHGAGAPMDSKFMGVFAEGLGSEGICVIRFEFEYMEYFRINGKKKPPSPANTLIKEFEKILDIVDSKGLINGGKSMGGRIASMLAANRETYGNPVSGVVCLGYPFHPPGRKDKPRITHLTSLETPMLICQGERDVFGGRDFVRRLDLPKSILLQWLRDGDHSFKPKKSSGATVEVNCEVAIKSVKSFIKTRVS